MSFQKKTKTASSNKTDNYKTKYRTTIKVVSGKMVHRPDQSQAAPIKRRQLRKKMQIKEKNTNQSSVSPMITRIIGSSNCVGTILNGYTQIHKTTIRIHLVIWLTCSTLKMETSYLILFDIINWKPLTTFCYSIVNSIVLLLYQV